MTKTIDGIISIPGVTISSDAGCVNEDGETFDAPYLVLEVQVGTMRRTYNWLIGDWDTDQANSPLTVGDLRRHPELLPLTRYDAIPPAADADDEDEIDANEDFAPALRKHLDQLARRMHDAHDEMQLEGHLNYLFRCCDGAEGYICYSPRGFGNEYTLYGYLPGEKEAALMWVRSQDDPNNANSWWKVLTPEQARARHKEMLELEDQGIEQYFGEGVMRWGD